MTTDPPYERPHRVDSFDDVVIHVGYHKTGSTLLQERLFVPERGFLSPWSQSYYHQKMLLDRPNRGWSDRVRSAFAPGIEQARERGLVPVLSCEALSGDIWRRGTANGFGNFHAAETLAEAFPGSRVAIVHREQIAMLASLYKHSLRSHWSHSLHAFLDQTPLKEGMAPVVNLGYLEYSWLLEHYQSLFGPESVLAIPFEMVREADEWNTRWRRFLGVPVEPDWFAARENPGYAAATVQAKRYANYLLPASANPNRTRTGHLVNKVSFKLDSYVPDGIRRASDKKLLSDVRDAVGTRFGPDNARLATLTGDDWSRFRY